MNIEELRKQYQDDFPLPWTVGGTLKPKRTTTLLCADGSGLCLPGAGIITHSMLKNLVNVYNAGPAILARLTACEALEKAAENLLRDTEHVSVLFMDQLRAALAALNEPAGVP